MSGRKIQLCLVSILLATLLGFAFPTTGRAVPAVPLWYTLLQPDGSSFKARQWGDENFHGWETAERFSIVFDQDLLSWTYAVHDSDGWLISSLLPVRKGYFPAGLKERIRPTGRARLQVPLKRILKEIFTESPQAGSSGTEALEKVVPPGRTANIPFILINFSNTTSTYQKENFNTLLFGTGNHSMKDFYEEISYGAFSVSAGPSGVAGWYQASNTHNYYGQNDWRGNDRWPGNLVYEAVSQADAAGFDFGPYDQDGDCYVDVVAIVHQGSGEEAGGPSTDIWSHSWDLNSARYYGYSRYGEFTTRTPCPRGGYIKVNDYIIQPEILWGGQQTIGVFAHEYGHAIGLPDLYDTDGSSEGIGNWSLMASGSWNYVATPGDRPAHMDAWSKYKLGWVSPKQVNGTLTDVPITQASSADDVYQLLSGSPSAGGEYFLVENRQKAGFDEGLPGAGLLIWHIDERKTTNTKECYPGGPSCPTQHYHVALEQADNLYDLEKNRNRGNAGDPYPGSTGNTSFTASSSPNSKLYNGSASNVNITNISTPGFTMTATLSTSTSLFGVSGQVAASGGGGVSGVTMSFSVVSGSGSVPASVQTDGSGNWSQSGFQPGTTYRVTPSKSGYTFNPTSLDFSGASTTLNFTGTQNSFGVSGQVAASGGGGVSGVTMSFSVVSGSGSVPASVQTDGSGNWSQSGFQPGTTYRVTPSKSGYVFLPSSRSFTGATTALNFTGYGY